MFKPLRKPENTMDEASMISVLTNAEYGILSTIGPDGYPYGIPMSFVYINNAIYFHGAAEGHKHENITYNDKVSFCIVGKTEVVAEKFTTNYESVILFGNISEVKGTEKQEALFSIVNKYSQQYSEKGKTILQNMVDRIHVLKINIEHVVGKTKGY
jgi:uncharacterized protein